MVRRCALVFSLLFVVLTLAAQPGCIDLGVGGQRKSKKGGGGGGVAAPAPVPPPVIPSTNIVAPGTPEDERFDGRRGLGRGGYTVGADGIERLAFLRVIDSNLNGLFDQTEAGPNDTSQVMFTRRRAAGTWTAPIAISAADTEFKENPRLVTVNVGVNASVSFIFWREVGAGSGEIHMARVDAGDPPVVLTADTVISDGATPAGLTVPFPTFGNASPDTLVAELDPGDGSVYAAWAQFFGPGTLDECVVAARYDAGGTGLFPGNEPDEKIAITINNADALVGDVDDFADLPIALVPAPLPAVGGGGTMHIVYVATQPDGAVRAVRHRARTGAATWTPAAPGDIVSDTLVPTYRHPRIAVEADGDLYVAWAQGAAFPPTSVHHAYRPSGGPFAASASAVVPGGAPTSFRDLGIVLDGSTPVIAYKRQDLAGGALLAAGSVGTANASGPFAAETVLHLATSTEGGEGAGRIHLFRETPTNRIAIVYDAAPATFVPFEIYGVIRPSGGPFGAEVNLSLTAAVSRLAGFSGTTADTARFAWIEGANATAREVFGIPYSAGAFGGVFNLSGSPADSHGGEAGQAFDAGFVGVFGSPAAPTAGFWWREHLGAAQHDPFFARN